MKTKNQLTNRILSLVLAVAMVIGLLPMTSFTASAANISTSSSAIQKGHYIYFGSNGQKWRVLDASKTSMGTDGMFLFSENSLGTASSGPTAQNYTTNGLEAWCTNYYNGTNFTTAEKNVMLATTVAQSTGTYNGETSTNYALDSDYLFLLSAAEAANSAYFADDEARVLDHSNYQSKVWFLRTDNNSGTKGKIFSVGALGRITGAPIRSHGGNGENWSYRPGFNLDTSKLLFVTAATNGKSDGLSTISISGSEWKLTLKDSNSFTNGASISKTTLCAGQSVTVTHTALSAISTDYTNVTAAIFSGDTMLYYGSVNTDTSATSSTVILPDDLAAGSYTLNFYGEDWNGDKRTDIATGTPYSVNITIKNHTGGSATCTTPDVCTVCGTEYLNPNNHEYEKNNGICCDTYQPAELNESGYYEIGNAGQLFWFANHVNTVDRTASAVLVADIDLENRPWTPIGAMGEENSFRGVFDGQGHTIKGLYVEGSKNGVGFFGEVRTGTVKNFTIYGNVVVNTEVDYVGGVIGSICGLNSTDHGLERNGAIIQNITAFVNVTAKAHGIGMIGGFVGYANHQSLIEQCAWYGTFDAGEYRVDSGAGGFIGKIQENTGEVTIRNCGAYGTIKTGYAKNSYNNYATIYMGGFLSFSNTNAKTTFENCLFAGKFERGENLTDEAQLAAFGTLRSVNAIKNCYYLGDDGLAAVHSDSDLKPGSDNVEITSVTGEELKEGTVATQLGEYWTQGIHYPIPKDTKAHSDSATYTYTDNGDGTHKKTCNECGYVEAVNEEHYDDPATTYTDNGNGTHSFKCAKCDADVTEAHTIENHACTDCGAMEIVVSFNAGDYEWKTGDTLYFCRVSGDNEWEEYAFTATVAEDGTVTWTPDKTLCWDGTGEHRLIVSYPANMGLGWDDFAIPADQSDVEKLKEADCMNARWVGTPTTNVINFELKHRMAKVTVNYEVAEDVTTEISKIEVYSNAKYCIFSDADGLPINTSVGRYDVWVTPYHTGDQFTAFVSPDAYAADGNFIKITLSDESVREVKMSKAVTFEEGAEYTYTVVITADGAYLTCADECTFEYTDNGDGTHKKVCSKCGYVAASENHTLTYTVNGNTITAACSANCGHTGTATISAEDTTYNGTEQKTATVTYSDGWKSDELNVSYENNVNAGTATASITVGEVTASVEFTIEKATVTVTADAKSKPYGEADPELTYTVNGLFGDDVLTGALTREEGENAGSYAITLGTLTAGDNYTISFTGAELTITDGTAPTGTILIKENGWNKFWNTITFGIFCKDYVDVTITADGTGSGIAKVEYLLSGTALEENNIPVDGWTTLNADNGKYSFSIKPQNKVAVYVRITDEGGNVTVINSDGIVVYEDSKAVDTEVTYTYKENSNKDIAVEFNGNTVKSIVCSEKVLAANSDYSADYESGKIVLKATYLDTLNAGDYTFTVSYNPMGVENSGVTDLTTTFIVKVEPTSIDGAAVNVSGTFTYDGNAKTPDPMVVLNGETLVKDRDYAVSYAENVNAGTATVTVTGKGNYSGTASGSFRIERAKLTDISVQQNGKLPYDGGKALTPAVTANATALNGAKVYFIYSVDGSAYGSMPTFTDAGTYTVYYCAYTVDNNFFDHHDTFTVTIDKATVTEPTIASKPYNGSAQTADISGTDLYTVEKNNGGTEKGSYDVVLKLKDSANYKWSTTNNAEVTLQFVISAAQNAWDTNPSISGWTYGGAAKTPVGTAKYGAVKVVYTGKANDGTDYNSETAPTKAGNYTATFTVTGTEDYSGLSEQVNFTIAKKAVTVTANDASKIYGNSDPTLSYTNTTLVGQDALDVIVTRASGENANTYIITASQADGANPDYEITFKTGTFTIQKATLSVTAEDKTITYGDEVPAYTVRYEGFKNGDDKDDLGGTLDFYSYYRQFDDVGEYDICPHGLESDNYVFFYYFGKLTVNAKPITITIQNATSAYGEAVAQLNATDNGIVNGDTNVYSLATTATGTSNVGKYAITGTALDGNYDVTFVNGEYEITKREITITVDAKNTVVNTTLPIYTYKVEGLMGVDTLVTEPTLTCNANIALIGEYDITASGADAGGNYSIKYVPAKLTVLTDNAVDAAAGYTEELKDYDPATVTSEDKAELDEMLSEINTILADETTTDNGKKALEEVKEQVEKLIKEITDAAEATDTENTEKVENVTPENVTPENKNYLEGAKADLEKALEDNGGNYTEDEKKAIEDEIKRIDEALEVIGNVEAVEESIVKLPAVDTVKPDDEEAIKAITDAQTAYNALSDYEKSLVDEATKAALDKLAAALVAYDIVEGDGSSWTEDSDHNITFVVNGLFSKFVGIKVDGKDVDKANYEVKAGSTIITLKASYLDTLAVGEHTITVVYADGSTDGTFNVHANANSPATGDDFNIALYGSLMVVSVTALVVLLLASKKRKQVK